MFVISFLVFSFSRGTSLLSLRLHLFYSLHSRMCPQRFDVTTFLVYLRFLFLFSPRFVFDFRRVLGASLIGTGQNFRHIYSTQIKNIIQNKKILFDNILGIKTASIPQLKYLSFFPSRIFARLRRCSPAFRYRPRRFSISHYRLVATCRIVSSPGSLPIQALAFNVQSVR